MRMSTADLDADASVRDQLVMEHVGLVKAMASRLANRLPPQVEVSELVSVGVLGLIDAAGRFKPSLGVPFSAFARRRIHGAMLDSLRGLDWAPRAVRKLRRDVDSAIANLRFTLGREPQAADIAAGARRCRKRNTRRCSTSSSRPSSPPSGRVRSAKTAGRRSTSKIEPSEGPHALLEREELRGLLAGAIGDLPERERQILALYYEEELTLAEIGEVIGVGESRVSQLRTQAIARLRSALSTSITRKGAH